MHRAKATVLTEAPLVFGHVWIDLVRPRIDSTFEVVNIGKATLLQQSDGLRAALSSDNELRSVARRSVRLIVRKFLPKGSVLRHQFGQFRIRTVPARRLIRMALLHLSSALVVVETSPISLPRRALRKTVRSQSVRRLLDSHRRRDIAGRAAD